MIPPAPAAGTTDLATPFLEYRLRWRASDSRPGKHAARHAGAGGDVQSCRPFWQLPDARRIDIRRSITDPFGGIMVRQTEQRSSISVVLAIDTSLSMHPAADRSSRAAIAALAQAAARSALRGGDAFGMVAFDRTIRAELSLPPTRVRSAVRAAIAALGADATRRSTPAGRSADGIVQLAGWLPQRRCLLLLASDFHLPATLIQAALVSLARHDVAPIVLDSDRSDGDPDRLPRAGLLRLQDVETGRQRLLLMRPGLRRRWRAADAARRRDQDALFARHGRAAFHAAGTIDIAALSEHLMAG